MDFVQTMKDWRRMCNAIQSENQKSPSGSWCSNCPIEQFCVIDTEIKDSTDDVFRIIDERVQTWADKNKEPVYPTWYDYLHSIGILYNKHVAGGDVTEIHWGNMMTPIPADTAQKLGLQPKEG